MSRTRTRQRRPELETLPKSGFAVGGVVSGPAFVHLDGGCRPSSRPLIRVARIEDDRVFVTGGVLAGAKAGDVYRVTSGDVLILDPETREELGRTSSVSLHLRVRKAEERFSECEVLSRRGAVQVGDVAEVVAA